MTRTRTFYAQIDESYPGAGDLVIQAVTSFEGDAHADNLDPEAQRWHDEHPHYGNLVLLDLAEGEVASEGDEVRVDADGVAELV